MATKIISAEDCNSHNQPATQRNSDMNDSYYAFSSTTESGFILLKVYNPKNGVHTCIKYIPTQDLPKKEQSKRPVAKLWWVAKNDVNDRELLLTIEGVNIDLLNRRNINLLIKSAIRYHKRSNCISLETATDLTNFIVGTKHF